MYICFNLSTSLLCVTTTTNKLPEVAIYVCNIRVLGHTLELRNQCTCFCFLSLHLHHLFFFFFSFFIKLCFPQLCFFISFSAEAFNHNEHYYKLYYITQV
ncbi:GSCOCG00007496001-RA-CDS [Cotesia congregata]|nr:GSCOCG00007496001-RA-CDS [Cotesia congregata]